MLYLGSNNLLPTIDPPDWQALGFGAEDWPTKAPRLVITQLATHNALARDKFSEKYVVNAGSYEGCGCGFNYNAFRDSDETAEDTVDAYIRVAQESRQALAEYVSSHNVTSLYGCWAGDEGLTVEHEFDLSIEQLGVSTFVLPERAKMSIRCA